MVSYMEIVCAFAFESSHLLENLIFVPKSLIFPCICIQYVHSCISYFKICYKSIHQVFNGLVSYIFAHLNLLTFMINTSALLMIIIVSHVITENDILL